MNAEQVVGQLMEVYGTCRTYRDSGQVLTCFLGRQGQLPRTDVKPFTTAFVRPNRFRFEYRKRYRVEGEWCRRVVWADGTDVRTWWDARTGVERPESLGLALAGATGVSGGSAHIVPALLLPAQVRGRPFAETVHIDSLTDESLAEVHCYRLSGHLLWPGRESESTVVQAEDPPLAVWIDRDNYLIRRIELGCRHDTFRTESVIEYDAAVGVTISEDELRFGVAEDTAS
jgi:hypothetical protein